MQDNYHSLHHFFFPFKWDILSDKFKSTEKKEKLSFDKRTSLHDFEIHLTVGNTWKRCPFNISTSEDYNEFSYFYSFVRKTLYDVNEYDEGSEKGAHQLMRYYEYNLNNEEVNQYIIEYFEKDNGILICKTLFLKVSGISLHVFNTGIAILSFNLINDFPEQQSQDQILLINEFGRRIYPQFLGEDGVATTQKVFLAKSIQLKIGNSVNYIEDFKSYNDFSNINVHQTFHPPKFIAGLLNESKFIFHVQNDLESSKVLLSRVVDDRLFFLCWYGNNILANTLTDLNSDSYSWWYAFVFGDKTPNSSIANIDLQKQHIKNHTYSRWLAYGTLYGMSRDSFVCISSDINYMKQYQLPRIDVHMKSIYYQFVILCLAQRASVLKFSGEIANLSELAFALELNENLVNSVKDIYANYIEFVNKIYFKEISSQIQAIEIYKQFQDIMSVHDEVDRLNAQIATLFNYLNIEKDERQNLESHRLTKIATWFLPASLLCSLFGISFITEKTNLYGGNPDLKVWIAWIIILVLGAGITGAIFKFKNKVK